jgi:ADP-heptose:LPS heptosyltransferase
LASIPASELAREILDACLKDGAWPTRALDDLITRALDEDDQFLSINATRALFGLVIEQLGDLFEPALCDVYTRLFAHVISRALPEYDADELVRRYRRVRQVRRFLGGEVRRVFVLSRVTFGADVAVTSVALAAAKERFPDAEICLVGPAKNAEMFAADPRVFPIPVYYGRGSVLRERLLAAAELRVSIDELSSVVIDPDSRLTQLGLIPVCDDARYFFFESRAFGGAMNAPLPQLTAEWLSEVFDVQHHKPYVAPVVQPRVAEIAVSLGTGENACKRIDDDFEFALLQKLLTYGHSIVVDRGAGGEEALRVEALAAKLGQPALLHLHDGSYASFASHIAQSALYVGYDSAGQHVAAAAGVPLVSVFTGHVSERMFNRWRPATPHSHVVAVDAASRSTALERTLKAIEAAVAEGHQPWVAPTDSSS